MEKKPEAKAGKKNSLNKLLGFDIRINRESIPRLVPFILFISTLILIYIANKYYAERILLKQTQLSSEIKDLRAEYLTRKSEYMSKTKLSEISVKTEKLGLKELREPQKKVIVHDGER